MKAPVSTSISMKLSFCSQSRRAGGQSMAWTGFLGWESKLEMELAATEEAVESSGEVWVALVPRQATSGRGGGDPMPWSPSHNLFPDDPLKLQGGLHLRDSFPNLRWNQHRTLDLSLNLAVASGLDLTFSAGPCLPPHCVH